jgi:hypothetical protein
MIDVANKDKEIIIRLPIEMMDADFVQTFLKRIELENVVGKSCLSEDDAWELSETLKESWWAENKSEILKRIGE